jgi:DNA-binding NtrC family response regulator
MRSERPLSEWMRDQEREYLVRKLKTFRGRVGLAAKSCGVDVRTMYRKMRLYGLDKKSFTTHAQNSSPNLNPIRHRGTHRLTRS